jgi:hypothetical protein
LEQNEYKHVGWGGSLKCVVVNLVLCIDPEIELSELLIQNEQSEMADRVYDEKALFKSTESKYIPLLTALQVPTVDVLTKLTVESVRD